MSTMSISSINQKVVTAIQDFEKPGEHRKILVDEAIGSTAKIGLGILQIPDFITEHVIAPALHAHLSEFKKPQQDIPEISLIDKVINAYKSNVKNELYEEKSISKDINTIKYYAQRQEDYVFKQKSGKDHLFFPKNIESNINNNHNKAIIEADQEVAQKIKGNIIKKIGLGVIENIPVVKFITKDFASTVENGESFKDNFTNYSDIGIVHNNSARIHNEVKGMAQDIIENNPLDSRDKFNVSDQVEFTRRVSVQNAYIDNSLKNTYGYVAKGGLRMLTSSFINTVESLQRMKEASGFIFGLQDKAENMSQSFIVEKSSEGMCLVGNVRANRAEISIEQENRNRLNKTIDLISGNEKDIAVIDKAIKERRGGGSLEKTTFLSLMNIVKRDDVKNINIHYLPTDKTE